MSDEPTEDPWHEGKLHMYPKKGVNIAVLQFNDETWLGYKRHPNQDDWSRYDQITSKHRLKERRLDMGAWLAKLRPEPEEDLLAQFLIDQIEPLPFDEFFDDVEATTEGAAMFEAMETAASVLNEGGGCLECGANLEDDESHYEDGSIRHKRGCRLASFMMWRLLHQEDQDRTPSMGQVIKAALDQIARMK